MLEIEADLVALEDGDVHPWRQRREAAGSRTVGENERAGLGDRTGGASNAKLVIIHARAVEGRLNRETGGKCALQARPERGIAVTVGPVVLREPGDERGRALEREAAG